MTSDPLREALPCNFRFVSGHECLMTARHVIHRGRWAGSEPNHPFQPHDRRKPDPTREALVRLVAVVDAGTIIWRDPVPADAMAAIHHAKETLAALSTTPAPTGDAAWAAAEAALPEGWDFGLTMTAERRYRASAAPLRAITGVYAVADTPAAALLALADRLREARP